MILLDEEHLLMIEPRGPAEVPAVLDSLARRLSAAYSASQPSRDSYRGTHGCVCGANSDNRDHYIAVGGRVLRTNSLCVHYLIQHRSEIPESEMLKLTGLALEEAEIAEKIHGIDADMIWWWRCSGCQEVFAVKDGRRAHACKYENARLERADPPAGQPGKRAGCV